MPASYKSNSGDTYPMSSFHACSAPPITSSIISTLQLRSITQMSPPLGRTRSNRIHCPSCDHTG